jgi:hypothetical protein
MSAASKASQQLVKQGKQAKWGTSHTLTAAIAALSSLVPAASKATFYS